MTVEFKNLILNNKKFYILLIGIMYKSHAEMRVSMNGVYEIVRYAYQKSPLYQKILESNKGINLEEWNTIPIITKNNIKESYESIYSVEYMLGQKYKEALHVFTSGSTGKVFEVLWDQKDFNKSLLSLWIYRKKYYGINPDDKMCFFFSIRHFGAEELEYEENTTNLGFSKCALDEGKVIRIYKKMYEYDPIWILLQPSMATWLIHIAKKYSLPKLRSLKYMELSGEMLFASTRKEIIDFFQCNICNQYGSHEVNSIAYECPYGNLHCLNSNVKVEILKGGYLAKDSEEGEIVVTSLHNHATPFIRYNTEDKGAIYHNVKCQCNNSNPILKLTSGRSNDFIINEDGTRIPAYIFARAVESINAIADNPIHQFQIIQDDFNQFTVKMVIEEEEDIDDIVNLFPKFVLQPSLDYACYKFEFYDTLFSSENEEKLLYFKNAMKK